MEEKVLNNLEKEIQAMFARITGLEVEEIGMEADIVKDLGIDSLKVIEITVELERSYKIRLKDSDLKNIRTVKDAVHLLSNLLEKNNKKDMQKAIA